MEPEIRTLTAAVLCIETRTIKRADGTEQTREVIVGKAVGFNELSQLLGGWFREQIEPGALDGCDVSDVVCIKNHDNNILLGRKNARMQAESLTLEIREDGAYFVAYPPDTQAARDTIEEIRAGLILGCSFQFTVAPGGSEWGTDPETGGEVRTVKKIAKLYDVGPVTFPAYLQTDTSIAKRDYDSAKEQRATLEAERRQAQDPTPKDAPNPEAVAAALTIEHDHRARRLRLAMLD